MTDPWDDGIFTDPIVCRFFVVSILSSHGSVMGLEKQDIQDLILLVVDLPHDKVSVNKRCLF